MTVSVACRSFCQINFYLMWKRPESASRICFHQKSTTLAYVLEVTVYTLPICQTSFASPLLYHEVYFLSFDFFHLQCLIYSVLYYCITCAFVICLIMRYHTHRRPRRSQHHNHNQIVNWAYYSSWMAHLLAYLRVCEALKQQPLRVLQ